MLCYNEYFILNDECKIKQSVRYYQIFYHQKGGFKDF